MTFLDARLMIKRIDTKLNYVGYKSNYAPESQWTYIMDQLETVLRDAKTQSDKVNNILERIETIDVLEDGFQNIQQADIDIFESKLQETQRLIELQKALKRETINVSAC